MKHMRRIVEKDGVKLMFGQRPYGNNQQAVVLVDHRGFDYAHEKCLEIERANGLKDHHD